MKKIYSLLLLVITSVSFGQVLTDNFNYPDSALLTDNGWTAHSGGTTEAITVGASNGLTYAGYNTTAGNAALLDNNGQDVNKSFTAPVTSGSLYYSFLIKVTSAVDGYFAHLGTAPSSFVGRVFARPSATTGKINFGVANGTAVYGTTDYDLNTTYLIIVKYDVSTTGALSLWVKSSGVPATEAAAGTPDATATGSGSASIAGFFLRQYNAGVNIAVDEVKVYTTWFGATPCSLSLGTETTACNAVTLNLDTYTATIPFTGGGTGTYNLSANAGTIGGANPSTTAAGDIVISNIPEGTSVTLTVSGACGFTKTIASPECKPVNALPYSEPFNYTVGSALGSSQKWSNVNTGDDIVAITGNLTYTGVTSTGNSISLSGGGKECTTPFTPTTSGTLYTAFLLNVTDLALMTEGSSSYFAGICGTSNSDYKGRLFVKRIGTQYSFGFDIPSTTGNYETTLRNVGTTVYVVIGYDFTANTLTLWINPTNGSAPALGAVPTTPFTSLGWFTLRQDTDTSTPAITVDELRITTTLADLGLTLGVSKNNDIAGLKMYPNPVSNGTLFIETAANAEKTVAVYDVLGKLVLNTTTSDNAVNVSSLHTGIYIVNITEEGKTAAKKLVIR